MDVGLYQGDGEEWDRFVQHCDARWTHFHLYGWRSVIAGTFGHECPYLAARTDGELVGVLPLVRVRSRLFGHYLVSMPFLNYGGPLGEPRAVQGLVSEAVGLAEATGVDLLELRNRTPAEIPLEVSKRKITVVLDLSPGTDGLWDQLKAKVRSQVRRPKKEGIEVRFGLDERRAFHDVFSRHMRDLGTPAQPRQFFDRIAAQFEDSVWFGSAYWRGRPVAAGCAFRWGDELEVTWASALREFNRMAPNMLLYWRFIERAVEQGIASFNFGRCTPGGGTHRFKRQWGGRDEPLSWYYKAEGRRAKTPSPDDGAYSWGPAIWRRLPVGLTRWLGPRIVRYIP